MSAQSAAVWCCTSCGAVYHKDFPRCPNDGAEVQLAERDPLLDRTFGHYVIDRLIGEGGMGRVYAAHHATLSAKRYAIKVLLGDVAATSSMRRRFAKEAESASKLDHPNIVDVLDYGEMPSGLPYIVMDYVDGVPLTRLLDGCPMDPARVLRLARAVCEGLAYAHDAGVVHRDLKPDNVMVVIASDGSEVPRIADFGLATTLDPSGTSRLTTTGMAMGTPAYAAPEQMAGKRVDGRADLYSLGMTMFEMLTGGKLPFEGHPLELMSAKAHREAPRLTALVPTLALPAGLEELVAQLIRRKSTERPASSHALLAALDRIATGVGHSESDVAPFDRPVGSDGAADVVRPNVRSPGVQRVVKTFEVRRAKSILPVLLIASSAAAATMGWVYQRRIASNRPTLDAVVMRAASDSAPRPSLKSNPSELKDNLAAAGAAGSSSAVDTTAIEIDSAPSTESGAIAPDTAAPEQPTPPAPEAAELPAAEHVDNEVVPAPIAQSTKNRKHKVRRPTAPARDGERTAKLKQVASREPLVDSLPRSQPASAGTVSGSAGVAPEPASPEPIRAALQSPSSTAMIESPTAPTPRMAVEIAGIDVTGAVSRSVVRNAVERVMPAIRQCSSSTARTVRTQFMIDESRRAQNVRGSSACITAALGGMRFDTTPDVGNAEVDLQIRFFQKP